MNNQWHSSQFQQDQPSQTGQVKMFDPTQFQAPPAFGGTESNKSVSHLSPQQQQQQQQNSGVLYPQQSAETAPSWNSWDSWDWRPEDNSPLCQGKEDQVEQGPETSTVSQTQHFVGGVIDSGYYGNDQYSTMWNQGLNRTDEYPHSQGYSQPDPEAHYDQGQQQFAGVMFGQDQDENGFNSQQQHNQNILQNQQYFDGQFYDQVQQGQHVVVDDGQVYFHNDQYPGQSYDQPCDSAAWPVQENGHWVGGYSGQQHFSDQTSEAADIDELQQVGFSQGTDAQSIAQNTQESIAQNTQESIAQNTQESIAQTPSGSSNSHESMIVGPRLEVHDDDDDGTVSGFFGRDEDGDVQLDSQRHVISSDHNSGSEISSGVNQFLTVAPVFHRTNSEISNASLSTLNLSLGDDDDDDGQEPLHNIQALVQRMEEIDLARRVSVVQNGNTSNSLAEDKTSVEELHIGADSTLNQGLVSDHKQKQGDYTGFGNTTVIHSHLPHSLPFDNNAGISSADGDQPGSAGSVESGGSSGLADWEIVPPSTNLVSPDHNISLDANVSFLAGKPDGGVNMLSGLGKVYQEDKPLQQVPNPPVNVTSDHSIPDAFTNTFLTNSPAHHNTSLTMPHAESIQASYDSRGRAGSPFVAAFTDHKQEESHFLKTQTPAQVTTSASPKFHQDFTKTQPSLQPEDGTDNSFEKEHVKGPRPAAVPKLTTSLPSSHSQLSTLQNIQPSENKVTSSAQLNSQRPRESTSHPAIHKLSSSSLIDDGSRINKRDFEHSIMPAGTDSAHSIKSSGTNSVHSKDSEEPPIRSSSRNSEEVSASSQQRRQSAFHPVSRPRQTAMSPATTLWDNSETPTSNILLAPAMPLIIPNLNPYPFSASNTMPVNKSGAMTEGKGSAAIENDSMRSGPGSAADLSIDSRHNERKDERSRNQDSRKRSNKNRSLDSLDEIDAVVEGQRDRSYYSQQQDSRDTSFNSSKQDSYRRESDRSFSRSDRPMSRSDLPMSRSDLPMSRSERSSGHYHYERPLSRTEGYSREDTYRRNRGSYRDFGDSSFDERYDRPRSRQDESHSSRPSSRSGQEAERSRGTYDRDKEHYYRNRDESHSSRPSSRSGQEAERSRGTYDRDKEHYYRDRNRGYSYDNYARQVDYNQDDRERYYRYNREKEARYERAYFVEYYGPKHADYYYQQYLAQQQLRQEGRRHSNQESEQSSSRSQSRGSTPATAPSPGIPPPPAIKSGPDYYGNHGSRPDSRADYNHDYYGRNYNLPGYNPYYEGYGYDPYAYGYYTAYDVYAQGYNTGRMTPPKYTYPHVRAGFGPTGQLIKVLPNRPADGQPAIIEVQDVQAVLESCPEADELKQFPGPLTREHTHKKDVLFFCQLKARSCAEDINMVDRESAQLIWRFLELLIKQNGVVVGTDLSDLLLEGHEPSTHEYSVHGVRISQSPELLDTVPEGNSEDSISSRASPAVRVTSDRTVINSADREREKWSDRFRNLLLYGRKKDALECAMKHNLWGHALFLASKMDTRTHANVMTRFANGAIRMNDPLQTLYQLMSGRQPAAVTCVVDERWGDWRPHLAMILSNQTSKQDLDRKSITTLGDTLAARGCLHASHFCYLMAQVNFGSYSKKTSKIVLIGSNHNLSLEEFATNEAIQCTEVYEYAQTLANPAFCLPHFQVFKYLYACRQADYGMSLEALQYCEMIASNIQQYPAWFHSPFVRLVQQLSSKLQFSDPQRLIAGDDTPEPMWLQLLEKMCASYDDGSIQSFSGSVTPALFPGTTTSSESGDYSSYGYGYVGDTPAMNNVSLSSGTDTYRNQQQIQGDTTGYNGGHDLGVITDQVQHLSIANTDQQPPQHHQQHVGQKVDSSNQQYDYSQMQQQQLQRTGYHYTNYGNQQEQHQEGEYHQEQPQSSHHQQQPQSSHHQQQPQSSHHHQLSQSSHQQSLPTQSATVPAAGDAGYGYALDPNSVTDHISHPGDPQLDSSSSATQLGSHLHSQEYGHYEAVQQQQQHLPYRASISASEDDDDDDNDDDDDVTDGAANGFDYFGAVGTQIVAPPHRYRHMSGSSTGSTRRRRRTASESSTGSVKAAPHKPPPQQQYSLDSGKGGDKMKPGQPNNAGGSWFGFLNKFKVKGKNEMILPDDKNPAIVWDPVKKKWSNADGTEEVETSAAPPPKDTDLMSKHAGITSNISGPPPPPPPAGGLGSNRFSLKAKGARNQYVDVTNPKSVSVPQNLFSVMPPNNISTAAPKVFLPGQTNVAATRDVNNSHVDNSMLTVPASTDSLSRSSSMSSLSQEIHQFLAESFTDSTNTTDPIPAAPSMPVLFNPASLKSTSGGKGHTSSTAGPGLKVGQRRAYPK